MTYNVGGLNLTYSSPIEVGDNSNTTTTTITTTTTTTTTTTVNIHLECPDYGYTVYGWKEFELKTTVKSWPACSQHCQDRQDCRHWVWYKRRQFCVTMTSYTSKYPSTATVAGDRDCEGNMVTWSPTILLRKGVNQKEI